MGFKFIYKKKIHKLPLFVCTVKIIRDSIIQIYPQIDKIFKLYYIHEGEPLELISEDALVILLRLSKLSTIKFLVHEGNVETISQDELNYFQQSFIDKSQFDLKESLSCSQIQQQKQTYQQELYNPFNPPQANMQPQQVNIFQTSQRCLQQPQRPQQPQQSYQPQQPLQPQWPQNQQPMFPQQYPQYPQQQQNNRDNQMNLNPLHPTWEPIIVNPPQQPSARMQIQCQAPSWKLVDEAPQPLCKPYHYKAKLLANYQSVSFQRQEFQWLFTLMNEGDKTWPQTMKICCVEGIYYGKEFIINELIPNKQKEFQVKLRAPERVGFYVCKWQLQYFEGLKVTNLFVIEQLLEVVEEQILPKYIDTPFLAKARLVAEVLSDQSLNDICKFIQENNLLTQSLDNIIIMIADQKQRHLPGNTLKGN